MSHQLRMAVCSVTLRMARAIAVLGLASLAHAQVDEWPLEFSFSVAHDRFLVASPKHITVTVRSAGDRKLFVHRGGKLHHCQLVVTGADGKALPTPKRPFVEWGSTFGIPPRESLELRYDLNEFAVFRLPGTYGVTLERVWVHHGEPLKGAIRNPSESWTISVEQGSPEEYLRIADDLQTTLASSDVPAKVDVVRSLRYADLPRRSELLTMALQDTGGSVFDEALVALRFLPVAQAREVLVPLIRAEERAGRLARLAEVVAQIEDMETALAAVEALANKNAEARRASIRPFVRMAKRRADTSYLIAHPGSKLEEDRPYLQHISVKDYFTPWAEHMTPEQHSAIERLLKP